MENPHIVTASILTLQCCGKLAIDLNGHEHPGTVGKLPGDRALARPDLHNEVIGIGGCRGYDGICHLFTDQKMLTVTSHTPIISQKPNSPW
ncbi:MAG: hypothetical protein BWY85_01172 [Firmicutes bacterium ADurb.Bin506]|nr:MAG: hypothetical protein BWY85_01172 [Firmicutes bacterium ADurb.Bin506]